MRRELDIESSLIQYRERTHQRAPQGLRTGVLARLGEATLNVSLPFSLGAIFCTAGLAAIFSLWVTLNGIKHDANSPPPFLENTPSDFWSQTP